MRDLGNNAAGPCRVDSLDRLIELGDTETLDDLFLLFGVADHAPIILDLDLSALCSFCFLCHDLIVQSYAFWRDLPNQESRPKA